MCVYIYVYIYLRLDEPALEVGVNDGGGLRREGSVVDGPAADLLVAGGEEVDEVELLGAQEKNTKKKSIR